LVQKTAVIHKAYPCPTWSIEGNHDVQFNNLETLDRQPLGVLYAANVFQHLREEVFKDGNVQTRVIGVPYNPTRSLSDLRAIQKKPGDTYLIAVVHALAGKNPPPNVEDFFHEPVFRYEDLVTPDGPDVWMFGHWHRDQGIEVIGGKHFVNQGALSRGALIRENLERTPKVALIEMTNEGLTVRPQPLIVLPASEVFDLERKKADEAERQDLDQFVQRLVVNAEVNPTESIQTNIQALGSFAERVRDKALYYYELAEAG
jgi:DNA repair protein SbcD/Mre11